MTKPIEQENKTPLLRRILGALGPGVVTGAADDDPSGVATYSIAGAQLGTSLLWTAFLTWPLMGAVQMMCARIGMVTGMGLAGALRQKFPKPVLTIACIGLLLANTFNIGADLAGMADAAGLLTGIDSHIFVVIFGVGISYATIKLHYHQIASTLKWLTLVLLAYIATALLLKPDWSSIVHATFVPELPSSSGGWATLVAILGTTISPYLFFWQSSQEVEEEMAMGRRMLPSRQGATRHEIVDKRLDVGIGTFFSNLVMYFIILSTALTLHKSGIVDIESSKEASLALRPLAGELAFFLYTIGIIGVGVLAIPTLSGSAAYAFAETFDWAYGLDHKLQQARAFYSIIIVSTLVGVLMDFVKINPIRLLFWTAVINGLLAPFLLLGILAVASDKIIMQGQPSSLLSRATVSITIVLLFGAGIAMFVL